MTSYMEIQMRIKQIEKKSVQNARPHNEVSPWVISTAIGWIIIVVTCGWYIHRRLREIHQAREQRVRNTENERIQRELKSNPYVREKVISRIITQEILVEGEEVINNENSRNKKQNLRIHGGYSSNAYIQKKGGGLLLPQHQQRHDKYSTNLIDDDTGGDDDNYFVDSDLIDDDTGCDDDDNYSVDSDQQAISTTSLPSLLQESKQQSIHGQDINTTLCSICLEPFSTGDLLSWSKVLRCQHIFHFNCLMPWLLKRNCCPLCRVDLVEDDDFDTSFSGINMLEGIP